MFVPFLVLTPEDLFTKEKRRKPTSALGRHDFDVPPGTWDRAELVVFAAPEGEREILKNERGATDDLHGEIDYFSASTYIRNVTRREEAESDAHKLHP